MASTNGAGRLSTPTPSQLPPLPSSPSYSFASTANPLSAYFLPPPPPPRPAHAVLTRSDLEQSHAAYADLISTAKAYRVALAALSTAASAFGSALEACARLKEARAEPVSVSPTPSTVDGTAATTTTSRAASPVVGPPPPPRPGSSSACTADLLLSASGMHHLVANHQQIVSETVHRSFELPLTRELDKWRRSVDEEEETYRAAVAAQSSEIRRMERDGLRLHRQKRRDVARFRAHLVNLTAKLDALTTLNADHARALLRESQDTSVKILDASCSLVRAEVDIFESLARKGWTGGGLEDLLERGIDLFASEPEPGSADPDSPKLFSILPPKSILADAAANDDDAAAAAAVAAPRLGHSRFDSLLDTAYQSLTAMAAEQQRHADARSTIPSGLNRARGARLSSPPPIRRAPTDATHDDGNLSVDAVPSRPPHKRAGSENGPAMSLSLSLDPGVPREGDNEDEGGRMEAREVSVEYSTEEEEEEEEEEEKEGEEGEEEGDEEDEEDEEDGDDPSANVPTYSRLHPGEFGPGGDDVEDGSHPWRNEGLRRSLSGEIGKDLTVGDGEGRRRWAGDDADHGGGGGSVVGGVAG